MPPAAYLTTASHMCHTSSSIPKVLEANNDILPHIQLLQPPTALPAEHARGAFPQALESPRAGRPSDAASRPAAAHEVHVVAESGCRAACSVVIRDLLAWSSFKLRACTRRKAPRLTWRLLLQASPQQQAALDRILEHESRQLPWQHLLILLLLTAGGQRDYVTPLHDDAAQF